MKELIKNSNVFVDGNNLLYRHYHGRPVELNDQGLEIHAVKGFLSFIWKILHELTPQNLIVTFDSREKSFRHELYPAYKANRETMPLDLYHQLRPTYLGLKFMGVPTVMVDGVEADDVIASLCQKYADDGRANYIVTTDKDLAQLVSDDTFWLNAGTLEAMDKESVTSKFGVLPEKLVELLALVGDQSDNIPGIKGIGIKNGAELINRFGSIEAMISNKHWIKGKVGKEFRSQISQVNLNCQLLKVKTDVELPELNMERPQTSSLKRLCEVYGLTKIAS